MAKNCYICGSKLESDEFKHSYVHGKMRIVCDEDKTGFCEIHPDDLIIPEDTPSLGAPWWAAV